MARYAYCNVCKKEVEHPVRKPLETFQKIVWVILIIASVGILAIVYAFVVMNKKKEYCATCRTKVVFSSEPFEPEEEDQTPMTAKEKAMKKAGKIAETRKKVEEKKPEEDEDEEGAIFCEFCGEQIKEGLKRCPYCHAVL
jgi:hypothetical protein